MTHGLGVIDAISNNKQTNHTAIEQRSRFYCQNMKGRVAVYKKGSVRWPESEGAGKVTRYQW